MRNFISVSGKVPASDTDGDGWSLPRIYTASAMQTGIGLHSSCGGWERSVFIFEGMWGVEYVL